MKEKEKTVSVPVNDESGKETIVKVTVKKPNNQLLSQAQRVAAKCWTECVRDGIMTKKELLTFMKKSGIWDDAKDSDEEEIKNELGKLEKQLYVEGNNGSLTIQEAKELAVRMKLKRAELRDLISEKLSLEQNTAEALSDNAKFDFLVATCTYYADSNKLVFANLDEYTQKADGPVAFAAATALAQLLYSIDKDFELRLPENKFLKEHNLVNEDLMLVNDKNELVDTEGKKIDKFGYYINEEGKRTDAEGNLLDEEGNYIPTVSIVEANKPAIKTAKKTTKKTASES